MENDLPSRIPVNGSMQTAIPDEAPAGPRVDVWKEGFDYARTVRAREIQVRVGIAEA